MQAGSAAHHEDITVASSRETFDTNITSTGLLEGPQKEGGDEIDRQGINQSGRGKRPCLNKFRCICYVLTRS